MSSFIRLQKLRQRQHLHKQFLIQQKIEFAKFNKFKEDIDAIKTNKKEKKSSVKTPIKGSNTNNISEDNNINKKSVDDKDQEIDYSNLLSNLDQLYKKINQGNINMVIDKKSSE